MWTHLARRSRAAILAPTLVLALFGLGTGAARAEDRPTVTEPTLTVEVGAFNIGRVRGNGGGAIELRAGAWGRPLFRDRVWVAPIFGIGASGNRAVFGYFGAEADLALPRRWRMSGGFAFTRYATHGDVDLGGPLVFRSSFTIARRYQNGIEVGASFFHISNANLYRNNPGANQLSLVVEAPLRLASRRP